MFTDDLLPPDPAATFQLAPGVFISDAHVRLQYARGGGPGGQNVNKLNTKAELWIPVAQLVGMNERAKHRLIAVAGDSSPATPKPARFTSPLTLSARRMPIDPKSSSACAS
jgi:hypothetical protein